MPTENPQKEFTKNIWELSIPVLALDVVIFTIYKGELCIVTINTTPGVTNDHLMRLPGGILRSGEGLDVAFDRILLTKTGLSNIYKEQLITIGTPERDSRGHVVSIVYYALVDSQILLASLDLTRAHLVSIGDVLSSDIMAYDHADIVKYARQRLEWKMEYTNISQNILPARFTLSRLQEVYEIIFGHAFDKRNFRKKFLSTGMLHETDELDRESSNRPAKLYEFSDKELKITQLL
ncbi:MAG: NUDIX hydrolase [Candidatus Gracilibacteria bacterium]|nr:NUDIX hydrolase [Candidatus Gracilibacteria bacterium]